MFRKTLIISLISQRLSHWRQPFFLPVKYFLFISKSLLDLLNHILQKNFDTNCSLLVNKKGEGNLNFKSSLAQNSKNRNLFALLIIRWGRQAKNPKPKNNIP